MTLNTLRTKLAALRTKTLSSRTTEADSEPLRTPEGEEINPKLLILAILAANDGEEIEGITRMQKLVFLAQKETDLDGGYNFEPHDY